MMKGRTVNMEIKKALHDSITVPTLMYVSETWTCDEAQRIRIQAVGMSYLRGACGLNRMDNESNESVYGMFSVSFRSEGMNCGVVEVVKHSILRWFDHLERMEGDELTEDLQEWSGCCGCERKTTYKV